jgi:HK97 family phage major capsid protein
MNVRELRDRRATLLGDARAIVETAEKEDRDLSQEEQGKYDQFIADAGQLESRISRVESLPEVSEPPARRSAPGLIEHRGDSEIRAMAAYVKKGDRGAVRGLLAQDDKGQEEVRIHIPTGLESRAVVDSTMNITTNADGKYAVPTGWPGQIAMRRNEIRLAERLGVRMIPGKGTTVPYPFENADPQALAATAEQDDAHAQTYTRDTPVFGSKNFTLAKKTKKLELTEELLEDEDVNLMSFIADHMGRAIGVTHNSMLLTEIAANGTALKTFASATAVAAGEIEDIVYNDTLGYYMDDGGSIHWVMRPSTLGNIKSITGDARMYAPPSGDGKRLLEGYPVHYSNQAAATAAEAKDIYFGNWYYVGMREAPALSLIRDPYTVDGLVILKYSFRAVYGVLIAGAVGYGVHPAGGS